MVAHFLQGAERDSAPEFWAGMQVVQSRQSVKLLVYPSGVRIPPYPPLLI